MVLKSDALDFSLQKKHVSTMIIKELSMIKENIFLEKQEAFQSIHFSKRLNSHILLKDFTKLIRLTSLLNLMMMRIKRHISNFQKNDYFSI